MEQDVIPELTQLSRDNIDFSGNDKQINGGLVMPSANWTIAAMFAQTSGLPLKANVGTNEMEKEDSFFHNAITLGDILKDAGYSQTLMIGSDATFGGRRLYFTQHGDFEIIDYPAAKEAGWIPMDYEEWWGFEDEKLFEYAKNRLLQYQESGDPFNLTLLTVDTHFEDVYVCRLCDEESDIQYTNVLSCSSRQVSAFVEWIQQQDFYDNTTIVISGDHLTGDADYLNGIDSDYERKVYTTFIHPAVEYEDDSYRTYTTFDLFPTTLAALGIKIDGDRLGLGTNLFSDVQTLTERYGLDIETNELRKGSALMRELSGIEEEEIPEATATIAITEDEQKKNLEMMVSQCKDVGYMVASIGIKIWSEEDQSDQQYFVEKYTSQTGSQFNIRLNSFKQDMVHIEVYGILNTGKKFHLGSEIVNIR